MRRDLLFAIGLSVAGLLPQTAVAEQAHVYFWRDATGKAHYGDICPANATCRLKWMPKNVVGSTRASSSTAPLTKRDAPSSSFSGSATPAPVVSSGGGVGGGGGGGGSLGGGGGGGGGGGAAQSSAGARSGGTTTTAAGA